MKKICISKDWKFSNANPGFEYEKYENVDLPHDYQIKHKRKANMGDEVTCDSGDRNNGFYPYTNGQYVKYLKFEENKHYVLDIDGAYMCTSVTLNENFMGMHPYGYTPYLVDLTDCILKEITNKLVIETRPLSFSTRWYTGNGIYRDVFLWEGGKVRIEPRDMYISTNKVENGNADVRLRYEVSSDINTNAEIKFTVLYDGVEVYSESEIVNVKKNSKKQFERVITINNASLWDLDNPNLYTLKTDIYVKNTLEDESENTFGIRTVTADTKNGLLLNGKFIKLYGGCLHHDHAVLGASSFPDAEYRKLKRLKDAGYNAVRCAHNPPSLAFLEVCDKLGMLVMDEAFDKWNKTVMRCFRDYNVFFNDWAVRDVSYMVLRDRNHPCVISYSIGNELFEVNGTKGAKEWAETLSNEIKKYDDKNFVTSAMQKGFASWPVTDSSDPEDYKQYIEDRFHRYNKNRWEVLTQNAKEFQKPLDITGLNYEIEAYDYEYSFYPDRPMWGGETHAINAYDAWQKINERNYILGDFVWTAYDNMGEVGTGLAKWARDGRVGHIRPLYYPWRSCYQGDLDMCCNRRPQSYFRQAVWCKDTEVRIFTTHPEHFGEGFSGTRWHFYDVNESWTYDDKYVGRPIKVETYTSADKVEWFVNGKKIGESIPKKAIASIETVYEKGYIEAIAYKNGNVSASYKLETCEKASHINLSSQSEELIADNRNLCYVDITITDKNGRLCTDYEGEIECTVLGSELMGIYSANPCNEDDYTSNKCHIFKGRALAVLRTKTKGKVTLTVYNDELTGATFSINAVENSD